jgi:hypothetical protein
MSGNCFGNATEFCRHALCLVPSAREERRMPRYPRCGQVRAAVTGLLVVMLAVGCEAGIALNAVRSKGTPGALNTKGSLRVIAPACINGFDSCESVALVEKATNLEAWAFTYKERQRGPFGVPVGDLPMTLYIVGPKQACDVVEGMATTREGTDVAIKGIAEPCHGPFYFVKNR